MHLILTGATGLVGSSVLDAMLRNTAVSKISILSRSPVRMTEDAKDPRVRVITHTDFESYKPELLDQLKDADGCVWALGTSQTNVTEEQYVKITKDYTLAAANAFSTIKPSNHPFRFIHVSGEGATQSPGRFSPIFARVKGNTEKLLGTLSESKPTFRADSVRPAFVDPATHDAIKPYIPSSGATGIVPKLGLALLAPGIRCFVKSMHSPTEDLGSFLTEMAMGRYEAKLEGPGAFRLGGGYVIGNSGMRRILELIKKKLTKPHK
ncbi:Pc14g00360 [Penicillium rubens Wisconsin 54-1255]|uniref:Pc14g00360 protein n=2 Tax=Penicillium chrysogenum species complex TaxID=254878 RepID=B6H5K6_PENRW|nr:Pc14g00360 [Penicillium rubens Wisconsin 54-1255]